MSTSTISPKYQIVIPKELRQQLHLKPGQKVRLSISKKGILEVETASVAAQLYGKYNDVWGTDSAGYLRELRDGWEDHQKTLDGIQ